MLRNPSVSFLMAIRWDDFQPNKELIDELLDNPWAILEPQKIYIPVDGTAANQFLYLSSDISAGAWTPSTGSDLYAMLDEETASDTDYIQSASASACEIKFTSGATPDSTGGTCRYRLLPGEGSITVQLKQGASVLHTWGPHTLTGSAQDFAQTISATITDATDLRLNLEASAP